MVPDTSLELPTTFGHLETTMIVFHIGMRCDDIWVVCDDTCLICPDDDFGRRFTSSVQRCTWVSQHLLVFPDSIWLPHMKSWGGVSIYVDTLKLL